MIPSLVLAVSIVSCTVIFWDWVGLYSYSVAAALIATCAFLFALGMWWTTALLLKTEHTRAEVEREKNIVPFLREKLVIDYERSSRLFSSFLSSIADFAYTFDPQHRVLYANTALLNLWGKTLEDVMGKTLGQLGYPSELAYCLESQFDKVASTQTHVLGESYYTNRHGIAGTYEHVLSPLFNADGTFEAVIGISRDITHRRAVEEQLRQTEQRFNAAFDQAALGMVISNLEGRIIQANKAFCDMFGRDPSQIIGQDFRAYIYSREYTPDIEGARVNGGHRATLREKRYVKPNGQIVWTRCSVSIVRSGDSEQLLVIIEDTTQERQIEQKLRESEERLRLAVATGRLGVWELNAKDRRLNCFDSCKSNYGRDLAEPFTYQDMIEATHPEDRKRFLDTIEKAIHGTSEFDLEYRIIWPNQSVHCLLVRGRARDANDGSGVYVSAVSIDITDRKAAEEQRVALLEAERHARSEAERVGRMKDEFLATLSHELRTPLNAILGWAQILQNPSTEPNDIKQGLTVIERNARSQAQMIEDLLDMSRIVSGKVRLDVESIDVRPVIAAAIETVKPAAESKAISLTIDLQTNNAVIMADPNRLQQVLWNLLINSIKFTPRGGAAHISTQVDGSNLKITVSDTGEGIDPAFLPFVFDRFRQADATTTRKHGGLGLGLSIVKQFMDLHGGMVSVISDKKGGGTTFTLLLPIAAGAVATNPLPTSIRASTVMSHNPEPRDSPHTRIGGVRVLLVDDEADARQLAQRIMENAEATVSTAASVREAMSCLAEAHYDILVSDIGMPGEDGIDLIRKIREMNESRISQIPAIALTAYARFDDREKTRRAGYQVHLAKPIETESLVSAIAHLVHPGNAENN